MKTKAALVGAAIFLAGSLALKADSLPDGQIDFGKFPAPAAGSEYVEVNLTPSIISLSGKLIQKQEPEVADLLSRLHSVRVTVIGMDDENRLELKKRAEKIRKDLDSKSWDRVVTAHKSDQDVSVYLKTKGKERIQGLVVLATDGNQKAIFVNIVGDINPEEISLIGEKLDIDPLRKIGRSSRR